ncbi:hypothetical protein KSP40_PGU000625 [Platanthera guangdongensis]|uniref:Uncharacterized protein n=1 Tax=Platanthera guangdongensis TaxID=2320717 RepID=A0ABR2ME16_9ASPA
MFCSEKFNRRSYSGGFREHLPRCGAGCCPLVDSNVKTVFKWGIVTKEENDPRGSKIDSSPWGRTQRQAATEPFVNIPEDTIREALKVVLGTDTVPVYQLFGRMSYISLLWDNFDEESLTKFYARNALS